MQPLSQLPFESRYRTKSLLLQIPAKAKTYGWFVVFALRYILRTAEVEAKGRVVQIQARNNRFPVFSHSVTALSVNLKVRVQIDVAKRAFDAAGLWVRKRSRRWRWIRHKVLIKILEDVRSVIGHAHAYRKPADIVSGTEVPGVWRLAKEGGVIRAKRVHLGGPRSGVAVIP